MSGPLYISYYLLRLPIMPVTDAASRAVRPAVPVHLHFRAFAFHGFIYHLIPPHSPPSRPDGAALPRGQPVYPPREPSRINCSIFPPYPAALSAPMGRCSRLVRGYPRLQRVDVQSYPATLSTLWGRCTRPASYPRINCSIFPPYPAALSAQLDRCSRLVRIYPRLRRVDVSPSPAALSAPMGRCSRLVGAIPSAKGRCPSLWTIPWTLSVGNPRLCGTVD